MRHKTFNLTRLTVAQLRARRARLVRKFPDVEEALRGALLSQRRRCGKPGCRCARGELHGPYVYLAVRSGRRPRLLYIPTELTAVVRRRVQLAGRIEAALGEISALNVELLSRGELP